MHPHEFAEVCERRGLPQTGRWLLEYCVSIHAEDHVTFPPKSLEYMQVKSLFDKAEYDRLLNLTDIFTTCDLDITSLCLLSEHLLFKKKKLQTNTIEKTVFLKKAELVYSRFPNDSIINYIYALALVQCENADDEALVSDLLVKSIRLEGWNWAAWLELAKRETSVDETVGALYPFYVLEKLKAKRNFKALLRQLETPFKGNHRQYFAHLKAQCYHELRMFSKSVEQYEILAKTDPFSSQGMDTYSNCLFVLEREEDLSQLTHHWMDVNPNCFETCIIGGNYFSLKSEHDKAAVFFKKAVDFAPSDINAQLLLGHELVELRNPSAALAVYQNAIVLAKDSDSRPYYAIGQLFELINQFAFAVYYFEKASHIEKSDPRIWNALASCYHKLSRPDQAKLCLDRVNDGII